MHNQKGVSITGFLGAAIVLIIVGAVGIKLGPAYAEYYSIIKQMRAVVADPAVAGGSRRDIERAFGNRAQIEDIRSVTPADLEVLKDGSDITLSASYSVRVPMVGNLSACLDFNPTSKK